MPFSQNYIAATRRSGCVLLPQSSAASTRTVACLGRERPPHWTQQITYFVGDRIDLSYEAALLDFHALLMRHWRNCFQAAQP